MLWDLKTDRPIYIQLSEQITMKIVSGEYAVGSKLPSVRDMAAEAEVNPNTMQRALTELERDGLVYSQRTSGRFITEDKNMIDAVKDKLAMMQISEFFDKMALLGFTKEQTIRLMEKIQKGE